MSLNIVASSFCGFGGQPTVVGQVGGQSPAQAEVASPCHRERAAFSRAAPITLGVYPGP